MILRPLRALTELEDRCRRAEVGLGIWWPYWCWLWTWDWADDAGSLKLDAAREDVEEAFDATEAV